MDEEAQRVLVDVALDQPPLALDGASLVRDLEGRRRLVHLVRVRGRVGGRGRVRG